MLGLVPNNFDAHSVLYTITSRLMEVHIMSLLFQLKTTYGLKAYRFN